MTTAFDMQTDRTDLFNHVRAIWKRKLLITGIVFVVSVLAVIAALVMTPIYRSEVLVAPVSADKSQINLMQMTGGLGALAGLAGLKTGGGAAEEEALATLRSRIFTTEFIERHGLLTKLFYRKWNAETGEWDVKDPDKAPDLDDGYRKFNKKIRTISVNKKTGLVRLGIEWEDRFAAAEWANGLIEEVNQRLRERAIVEANNSIRYLEEELAETSVMELRQAIFRLIENQIQQRMLAKVRKEFAFKVIDPAVPSAEDKEIWPKRVLMVLSAFSVSLFFAMGLALVIAGLEDSPGARRSN